MAWVTPSTQTVGTLVTASIWNQDVKDNIIFLHDPPAARVYHSTTQSVSDVTETALAFNSERYDTDTIHDTSTNNSRLTCQTAGIYYVWGGAEGSGNLNSYRLAIRQDGTTRKAADQLYNASASALNSVTVAAIIQLAAAEYLELTFYQNSGSSVTINSTGNSSPEFGMQWIGSGA